MLSDIIRQTPLISGRVNIFNDFVERSGFRFMAGFLIKAGRWRVTCDAQRGFTFPLTHDEHTTPNTDSGQRDAEAGIAPARHLGCPGRLRIDPIEV